MWKLCIDDDRANRTVVELVRDEYTIGRADDNTVRLTERNISRHHARLLKRGELWLLVDLDSYNGCVVGGQRIRGEKPLTPGEAIVLGDYQLRVFDAAADAALTPESNATVPARRASSPGDRLIVLLGPNPLKEFTLRGARMRVGRGEECDIRLDDTSVSRVHVALHELTNGVYQIKDEASSNGLRVNGRAVVDAVLAPNDVIELGDVELVFVPKGQAFNARTYRRPSLRRAERMLAKFRRNPKLALSTGLGALVVGVLLFSLSSPGEEVARTTKTPAAQALDDAEAQMHAGQIEVAHETLRVIGPDSNLRHSGRFHEIERRWADDQFERAKRAASATEERHILERIAKATGVDSARRKRASELLSAAAGSDLVPSDLPRAMPDAGPEQDGEPKEPDRGASPKAKLIDLDEPVRTARERTGDDDDGSQPE
jgi:pSer/pThr/pTyr-binding forkhead associated (FHA) protein